MHVRYYSMTNIIVDGEDILKGDFNCEQSLILQYYMLISKCCIYLITNSNRNSISTDNNLFKRYAWDEMQTI